jgi:hypothetical protein
MESVSSMSRADRLLRVLPGGSDPENFDITIDGRTILVSNEDAMGMSYVDIESGQLGETVAVGGEPEGVTIARVDGSPMSLTRPTQPSQ